MTMVIIDPHFVPRERLTLTLGQAPEHLRPIVSAARDSNCAWAIVAQGHGPFTVPGRDGPTVVILGDDFTNAYGPDAFHRPSVETAITHAAGVVIVASGPDPRPYDYAAGGAVELSETGRRENIVLVETRPDYEHEWVDLVQACVPGIPMVVCSEPADEGGRHA